jgi:hypothetical protein
MSSQRASRASTTWNRLHPGRLRDLRHHGVDVAVQLALQRRAVAQLGAEARRAHFHGGPGALNQCAHRRNVDTERQGNSDHALAPHQPDFEREVAFHQREQRDQRLAGKVDVPDRFAGFVEHLAEGQVDGSEAGEQPQVGLARQRGQQAVRDAGHQAAIPACEASSRSDSRLTTA